MKSKAEIWKEIADELGALSVEEFRERLEKHKDDPLLKILEDLGYGEEMLKASK